MKVSQREIKHFEYLLISRGGFWIGVLITIPLFLLDTHKLNSTLSNTFILLFYCWAVMGSYILGYRLDEPPKWARWVIPNKWIEEWRYLVYEDHKSVKSVRSGLLHVIGGSALLTILVLAFLSGKL